jgi:predicted enzyme related to lactoylglutathione lyase
MVNGIGTLDELVVDCRDPERLAPFWLSVLGGAVVRTSTEWVSIRTSAGVLMAFQRVPEPKVGKNRLHLDVAVVDLSLACAAAVAQGATMFGRIHHDAFGKFQVMLDPEGNEFCFVINA